MSTDQTVRLSRNWKLPDELLKLQRLKQKNKQLAARIQQNNQKPQTNETDWASILEAKIVQKRKNPFAKVCESNKKQRTEDILPDEDDSVLGFFNTPPMPPKENKDTFVRETPTRPPPAKLVLKPFDSAEFAKILQQSGASQADDDAALEEQKFSKHLPMDWSIKTRARFFSKHELPDTTVKTSQMAIGLTSFVRCINTQDACTVDPLATRFNQATYYWQHPYLPWMTLFPRNSKENTQFALGERERKSLAEDWDYSFQGLFQLLRTLQCPYFYLCANTFTVLFRAAGVGGRVEIHALMSPTTRGLRNSLRQEGIEYTMPLRKDYGMNKSGSFTEEGNSVMATTGKEDSKLDEDTGLGAEEDDDGTEEWLEDLGVDQNVIKKIKTTHSRKIQTQEMSVDFSDNSLLLIEGVDCQGFFSFLLNAKSTITATGRLAGVPPTLIAPVAFPKATVQHLKTKSNKVRMDGVDYNSIELNGVILPTLLPYVCQLFGEKKNPFSVTMATSNVTLAFSKAAQKLLEYKQTDEQRNYSKYGGQIFEQENLADCGLSAEVIESMCRSGQDAVSILERVCYDHEYGYAFS